MGTDKHYDEMTVQELKSAQQDLTMQFEEYKKVVAEVYVEMAKLSEEYNKIINIIAKKNGQ